jgi:hypothetical protein
MDERIENVKPLVFVFLLANIDDDEEPLIKTQVHKRNSSFLS